MIARVLGSAAGGGVPQWNCACTNCQGARAGRLPRRTQSSVAISGDGERWLLLNCSPDIAAQIEDFQPLQPRGLRETPVAGMLLTDANVDHLGGLAVLRQAGRSRFIVRSSAVVRQIAVAQPAFAPFAAPPHRWLETPLDALCEAADADDLVGHELTVRTIPVRGVTPGYDGRRALRGAAVAYEIRDSNSGRRLLFAPVFSAIDVVLHDAIARADVAFLDGSFYADDELAEQQLMDKRARSLGHQPVGGADGTLAGLRGVGTRVIFTHCNNSNPMLDPGSDAAIRVHDAGGEIAYDGMSLTL